MPLPTRVILISLNLGFSRLLLGSFDNARVERSALLPVDCKQLESAFRAEAQQFVEYSRADPETGQYEFELSLAVLRAKFDDLETKCTGQTISDNDAAMAFFVDCNGAHALRVSETTADGAPAFRITQLRPQTPTDGKSQLTSVTLSG